MASSAMVATRWERLFAAESTLRMQATHLRLGAIKWRRYTNHNRLWFGGGVKKHIRANAVVLGQDIEVTRILRTGRLGLQLRFMSDRRMGKDRSHSDAQKYVELNCEKAQAKATSIPLAQWSLLFPMRTLDRDGKWRFCGED